MKPYKLGILVMVSINKKNFKPSLKDVKERYQRANFEDRVRSRKCGSRKDHYSPG